MRGGKKKKRRRKGKKRTRRRRNSVARIEWLEMTTKWAVKAKRVNEVQREKKMRCRKKK